MDLDDRELGLLKTLVAFGQANPQNNQIGNLIMSSLMDFATPKKTPQEEARDLLTQSYAQRIAGGEDMTEDLLSDFESLLNRDDTNPISTLKERISGRTNKFNINDVPEELQDTAIANKYQLAYNKALQSGDYTELSKFKEQYPEYKLDVDDEGVVSATKQQREWGIPAKLAMLFGGESLGQQVEDEDFVRNVTQEYARSKGGGIQDPTSEEGRRYLKKKGVTNDILKRIGANFSL